MVSKRKSKRLTRKSISKKGKSVRRMMKKSNRKVMKVLKKSRKSKGRKISKGRKSARFGNRWKFWKRWEDEKRGREYAYQCSDIKDDNNAICKSMLYSLKETPSKVTNESKKFLDSKYKITYSDFSILYNPIPIVTIFN